MSNLHDSHNMGYVVDLIHNPIVTLTNSILILSGEFFATWLTRILRQGQQAFRYAAKVLFGDGAEFAFSRFLNDDLIRVRHV